MSVTLSEKLKERIRARFLIEGEHWSKETYSECASQVCAEEIIRSLDKTLIALQFVARAYPEMDAGAVCRDAFEDFCQNVSSLPELL